MPLNPSAPDPARPYTAAGDRPSTSHAPHPDPGFFYAPHDTHFAYPQDPIDEEDDSEDDDVFAYLPPTTADQQADQHLHQHIPDQPAPDSPFSHISPPPPAADPHTRYPTEFTPVSQPAFTPDAKSDQSHPSSHFSPQTPHDPHFHFSQLPIHSPHGPQSPLHSSYQPQFSALPPPFAHSHHAVDTPPSTDSQADPDDPYRLRRVNSIPTTPTTSRPFTSRSRHSQVKVELPTHGDEKMDEETAAGSSRNYGKERPSSVMDSGSVSVTPSMMDYIDGESREGSTKMGFDFDAIEEEDSPYPEVRASVSNIDDPEMPSMTLRMWFIGLLLCMTGSALNVFFNFRQPAPTVAPLVLLLISYPIGKFAAFTLPIKTYRIRLPLPFKRKFEYEFSLNPGPWNIKEHVLVYIMANVAVGPPYALNAIVVSEIFYDIRLGFWFNLVLVLATQLTGFGLAGLCRRFLVWPASMVWPQNLVACTLLNTLHAEDDEGQGGITRYKFYMIATGSAFVFFFLPGFLFQALSVFSWVCWIAPKNVAINQLFGVSSGLGMSVLTFDWTQIAWIGSPLMVPWWAEMHVFFGFVLFYWILTPILYYSNVWELSYFPISANQPFDRFGNMYDVQRILSADNTFDLKAYENYSPLYLPATYAVTYLLAFALSTCVIVHTLLYHGRSLLNGIKRIKVEKDDIHAKLMRNYPEVPDWWYACFFTVFFCLAIVAAEVWHTNVPVWALLMAVALPILYVLPSGFIFAMTGQGITLNLIAQIIPGTVLPGNPLANMVFKAYSVQTLTEATMFVQDLKLGHYIKVPPRATFLVQSLATIMAAFVQVGVKEWMFSNVPDICHPNQKSSLTCPHNQVFFTASAVWGLIGPNRQFGKGSIYHPQLYAIIVGALLPLPFWLWQRRHPNSWLKFVSTPIILNGVSYIPPATGINYSSWFFVGFIFQYLIRRRNFGWWSKFNYVTSAALDSGTVLSLIVIFFTLQFPKGGFNVNWWGNHVYQETADFRRVPFRTAPPEGLS